MSNRDMKHLHAKKKPKSVSAKCVVCGLPFGRFEVVCPRCKSCQGCKEHSNDPNGNWCSHCDNYLDQDRNNERGPIQIIHHRPTHETDNFEEQ